MRIRMRDSTSFSESWLIFVIGAVQCINILDFMMVMPLGPDFAKALDIPVHMVGWIGGSYTFTAALAGLVGAVLLDNFSRKRTLLFFLAGLSLATLSGAFAWNLESLMVSRCLAGAFGGPVSTLGLAMIADYIPPERRGAAMGKVMGSFAIAAVFGVPFGLELSQRLSWHAPFIAVAAMALIVWIFAALKLPAASPNTGRLPVGERLQRMQHTLKNPLALLTYAVIVIGTISIFMLIPNFSAHVQFDLGYPREQLGWLYFAGGLVSFATMRVTGRWVDRFGATKVSFGFTAALCFSIYIGFISYPSWLPVVVFFMLFMLASSSRNVCLQTLASKVPEPRDRASFISLQNTLTHIGCSFGAFGAAHLMHETPTHQLLGIEQVAMIAFFMSLVIPWFIWRIETRLKQRLAY